MVQHPLTELIKYLICLSNRLERKKERRLLVLVLDTLKWWVMEAVRADKNCLERARGKNHHSNGGETRRQRKTGLFQRQMNLFELLRDEQFATVSSMC